MKFSAAQVVLQRARVALGAIMQRGDGELLVPPSIQPVARFPMPMPEQVMGVGQTFSQSFITAQTVIVNGVTAAQDITWFLLTRGLWRLTFKFRYDSSTMTTNLASQDRVTLTSPNLALVKAIESLQRVNSGPREANIVSFELAIERDGWSIDSHMDAGVAGDIIAWSMHCIGEKLV